MLCVLLAATALLVPRPASAADSYEVVVEYDGPYYHVVNSPTIDQLVEDPITTYAFETPYGVAAFLDAADGRVVNFVLDSGNKRIMAFETNMDILRFTDASATYNSPAALAGEFDADDIYLDTYAAPATLNVIPYSETVKIDGVPWSRVADATGYASGSEVYSIDYDATNGPIIDLPTGSLTSASTFEISYAASDYQGGGVYAFGRGDVDMGYRQAAATATEVLIDETTPAATSFEDLRSIFEIDVENSATYDELWVVDAQDNSTTQDEFLQLFTVAEDGAPVAFKEAYDDQVSSPSDIWVAEGPTTVDASAVALAAIAHVATATIWDENQLTGHSYRFDMTGANVTITDVTTGRVLLNSVAKTSIPCDAENFYLIPGVALEFDETVANGTDAVAPTTRTIPSRYAFVADTDNDRIKVLGVPSIDETSGDDLPGDAYTDVAHPTSGATYGVAADVYYYVTTPTTVPEGWKCGTMTRPVKENSVVVTEDPDGADPLVWTRVDDLGTAAPTDAVYELDWYEGVITFGDGLHGALPTASTEYSITATTTPDVVRYGTPGGGAGQFSAPNASCALWSDVLGCFVVYVADTGNNRIQKFHFYPENAALNTPPRVEYVTQWNTVTTSSDFLEGPTDIAVAAIGGATEAYFVVVADYGNDRVVVYEDTYFLNPLPDRGVPTFECVVGGTGNTLGMFASISGISVFENADDEMEIYISDNARANVTKYVLAPTPSITLLFTLGTTSYLPESFPPSGSYTFRYTTTNAPENNTVDFYYDTASTYTVATAKPCFAAGTYTSDDSPVTWVFSASPGGTPLDGTYYVYAVLRNESGVQVAIDQAASTELLTIDSDLVPAAQVRDDFDGDGTLLIAPSEVRTIDLQLSYPDSVVSVSFVGTFPANLLEIKAITPGDGWEGTEYTNRIFNASFDNAAGTFSVNSAVTGVPYGLSGSGSFDMAYVLVQAKGALSSTARALSGSFTLSPTLSDMRDYANAPVTSWAVRNMGVELAYVGDISTHPTGNTGTVPALVPDPDGYMSFVDLNAFVIGWNGGGTVTHDPICDMGPVTGSSPGLVPARDGELDVDDLLAFTGNWSWFADNGYNTPAMLGGTPGIAFMPLGEPVEGVTHLVVDSQMSKPMPGSLVEVQVGVSNAEMLTTAMVRVAYNPAQLALVGTQKGELLARDGSTVMFETIQREGVIELCLGRLNRANPGVSGNGCLATLTFRVVEPPETGLEYVFDLRDWRNDVLARGSSELTQYSSKLATTALFQNYPNPLNPQTSIVFALPTQQNVELAVYDLSGRVVKTLVNGAVEAGIHSIEWNGLDEAGSPAPSGVYFYKLRAGEFEQSRKLVVTR